MSFCKSEKIKKGHVSLLIISEYVEDEFALVTDWTNDQIFQINLQTDKINALHFEEGTTYFGVFYNKLTSKVLWSELYSPIVFQSSIAGTNKAEVFDNGM